MWRWEVVKMRRYEDEKMWRWEAEKVWRWEDVKVRRCEDEKVWRWENVKMRRWDTDPHYWENPALRRSREKKHEKKWKKRCSFSKQTVVIWRTNLQDWHNDRLNKSTGQKICISYGGFHKWGYPKIDALFHGNPKNGWWPKVPPFQETILSEICLEAHMYNIYICVYIISVLGGLDSHPHLPGFQLRLTCSSCGFCAPLSALAVSPTDMTRKACT
jgi:hypothetical protein